MAETSGFLATLLDAQTLADRRVLITAAGIPIDLLPAKGGDEVYNELGGRYLLRYLVPGQVGRFARGDAGRHFVTPTPYAPSEAIIYLSLP